MADAEQQNAVGQQLLQIHDNPPPPAVNPPPPVANHQVGPPPLEGELPPHDDVDEVLNSTTRLQDRSHRSRDANRSRLSTSDEVLLEMRDMNRNIAMMLLEAREDRERMKRIENKINVSESPINTSIGFSALPHIYYSNSYSVCFTQAQPTYSTANTQPHTYTAGMAVHQGQRQAQTYVTETCDHPSLRALRTDPYIMSAAQGQCNELEASQLSTVPNINNKKARGLMWAWGEASRHLYTDWPHDYVLVGSDNERVFYKDLNIEQWSYSYVSIIEKQSNPIVQKNMLSHLKDTYMESMLYGFKRAKGVHGKVLTAI
jgi:hypothetical protein